jgi:hypothetical protein
VSNILLETERKTFLEKTYSLAVLHKLAPFTLFFLFSFFASSFLKGEKIERTIKFTKYKNDGLWWTFLL